jgi:hypothetical protein
MIGIRRRFGGAFILSINHLVPRFLSLFIDPVFDPESGGSFQNVTSNTLQLQRLPGWNEEVKPFFRTTVFN